MTATAPPQLHGNVGPVLQRVQAVRTLSVKRASRPSPFPVPGERIKHKTSDGGFAKALPRPRTRQPKQRSQEGKRNAEGPTQ